MNWIDYREKLGISFDDSEKAIRLHNQLFNSLANCIGKFRVEEERKYASVLGVKCISDDFAGRARLALLGNPDDRPFTIASLYFNNNDSICDIVSRFVALINVMDDNTSKSLRVALETAFTDCKIECDIIEDEDGVFYFPKGAAELDRALVSDVLLWLDNYPESKKALIHALKEYADLSETNASFVIDDLRRALESFFQEFFKSKKTLENLKSEYGSYLKDKGVPKEIASNFESILQSYTTFNNNHAKHRTNATKNVVEYILYQTGNIIRLLITLSDT